MKTIAVVLAFSAMISSAHATIHYGFSTDAVGTARGAGYAPALVAIDMAVADGAAADGRLTLDEIMDFRLRANDHEPATLAGGGPEAGPRDGTAHFTAGSLADGVFRNFTPQFMFELTAAGDGLWSGWYVTDNLSADACYLSDYRCTFTGRWTRLDIPEPPPLAAFLPALLLAWRARRGGALGGCVGGGR